MEQKEFIVTSRGEGMPEALAATEKLGAARGLGRKENLRLRLLAEELFGMVRGIVGDVEARYTVGQEGESFVLRFAFEPELTRETRRQLIAVSTQGGNAAAKGFMGKLRDMIAAALLPGGSGPLPVSLSMGLMGVAGNSGPAAQQASAEAFNWSMKQHKDTIGARLSESEEAREAWDELEKSIVASIADDVVVRVAGQNAEVAIFKAFR